MSEAVMDADQSGGKKKKKPNRGGRNAGSGLPCRNYLFAARKPSTGLNEVLDQLVKASRYDNNRRAIELERRQTVDEILGRYAPNLAALVVREVAAKQALEAAKDKISAKNQEARKKLKDKDLQQDVKEAKAILADLRKQIKQQRQALFENKEVQTLLSESDKRSVEQKKKFRKESGLFHGTYQLIDIACSELGKGTPPKFRRFEGTGRLGLQFQRGVLWSRIEDGSSGERQFQVTPPSIAKLARRPTWYNIHFRVRSENREPVWCVLPVKIHREIPADALVKWVTLRRIVVGREVRIGDERHVHGGKVRWQIMLTLQRTGWPPYDRADTGTIAVNFGYRSMPEGLRVASFKDHAGNESTLVIPRAWINEFADKAEEVQSERDLQKNSMQTKLLEFKNNNPTPEWFKEATKNLHVWKSASAYAYLALTWRNNRFSGDYDTYHMLEEWRREDHRRGQYFNNLCDRFRNKRKNLYREKAKELRQQYQTLVLDNLDVKKFAAKPCPSSDADVTEAHRKNLSRAAIAELRSTLTCGLTQHIVVDAAWQTQTCSVCGNRELFNAAKELWHTCSKCNHSWDQDQNNCDNLLQEYSAYVCGEESGIEGGMRPAGAFKYADE